MANLFIPLPVVLQNAQFIKNNTTVYTVFYFHIYTPLRFLSSVSTDLRDATFRMWSFKDMATKPNTDAYIQNGILRYKKVEVTKEFTYELVSAISKIIAQQFKSKKIKNIVLLAVPPSVKNKKSTMLTCISVIAGQIAKDSSVKRMNYFLTKNILNGGTILERIVDVNTSHLTGKNTNTYDSLWNSLNVNRNQIPAGCKSDETGYILLDDVVTTGLNMAVCKDRLVQSGIIADNIVCLAIAKTEYPQ